MVSSTSRGTFPTNAAHGQSLNGKDEAVRNRYYPAGHWLQLKACASDAL